MFINVYANETMTQRHALAAFLVIVSLHIH